MLTLKFPDQLTTGVNDERQSCQHLSLFSSCGLFWGMSNLLCVVDRQNGPYPQYGWDFPGEVPENRKDPGNALRAFPATSLESTAGKPQAL